MSEQRSIHTQLYDLLAKLKPPVYDTHPVWTGDAEHMGQFISRRLNLETATGQPIDQFYVDRLKEHMPKPRRRRPDPRFKPRRPLDNGYLESDNDFIRNNHELVLAYLEDQESRYEP